MTGITRILLTALFVFVLIAPLWTQTNRLGVALSNNTTGMPLLGYPDLFHANFHPGVDVYYGWKLNKGDKNNWFVQLNGGAYYHQFVQTLVRLYPTLVYERAVNKRVSFSAGLGGGLGISFEGSNAFTLNEEGSYQSKANLGARTQYLAALELGGGYALNSTPNSARLMLKFCSFMQGPYVKSYVPVLPLNSFQIGIAVPLK